jgi:hypothetical protein
MTATSVRTTMALPVRQEEDDWIVLTSKKTREKKKKNVTTATTDERVKPMPKQSASLQMPNYTREEGKRMQAQGQSAAIKVLPRTP